PLIALLKTPNYIQTQNMLSVHKEQTTCPNVCDLSRCSSAIKSCYFGVVKERCDCCTVCAAGGVCGQGMTCEYRSGARGTCVCESHEPVCGSDGRTYHSVCRLKAENRRAEKSDIPAVIFIQTGSQNPSSMRYKFNFIADVVDKIAPAVVHLELLPFSSQDVPVSSGSGFIASEDGWIVTNAHVLTNKQHIKLELKNAMLYDATIKDVDQKLDIALIKIDSEVSKPRCPKPVTTGIISTTDRGGNELGLQNSVMEYIQTDAIINYANSGGPLVNLDGDVIGINTLKVTAGISFAIPSDRICQFLADSYDRQRKGLQTYFDLFFFFNYHVHFISLIRELREKESNFPDVSSGVYVYEVIPGTAAFSAGLVNQDVIISINGHPVHSTEDMSQAVQSNKVLSLVVRRANEKITLIMIPDEVD
uniref:HtrA serine peptidase 4 n=1 Tax=Cyprinus carpio TaxID=7962 RepID=A0A8C1KVQ4_CYPCA